MEIRTRNDGSLAIRGRERVKTKTPMCLWGLDDGETSGKGTTAWGASVRGKTQIQPRGQSHSQVEPSRHLDQGSGAQEEILLEVLAQGPGSNPLTA